MVDATGDRAERWREDLRLVERVLAGDGAAREALCVRLECVPRTLTAANARLGHFLSPDELADLAQDVVLSVWRKLGTFRGHATLEAWTWSFCHHELRNRVRRRRRRRAVVRASLAEIREPQAGATDPSSVDYDHLEEELAALDPAEQDVVRLKHFEHLTFSEIAARLGISPNTVKTRYYRGMVLLRRRLERREPPEA